MRVPVSSMHPSLVTALHDRKRKREHLVPATEQHLLPSPHVTDSAPTSFALEDPRIKRQHVLSPHLLQMSSTLKTPQRESLSDQQGTFSGSVTSSQPSVQSDLQWIAPDSYSVSNTNVQQPTVTMMEEDQQSVTPAPQHQDRLPPRVTGMSHSSSAPDLRLMLATELPDSRPLYLPVPGSYAGALVPYTSPEQMIAEAHKHVTSDLIHRMIDDFNDAQAHHDANIREAPVPSIVEMMDSSADNEAPAVHALPQYCTGITGSQIRKRKIEELPTDQNKRARGSECQDCMQLDSDCEVEMEYASP